MNVKNICKTCLITIAFSFFFISSVIAQEVKPPVKNNQPAQNTNTPTASPATDVKVDNMSDAQVRQYMQQLGQSGMTPAQLEAAASARGMDAIEIQKFKDRVAKLQSGQNTNDKNSREGERQQDTNPEKTTLSSSQRTPKSRIFGSELFSGGADSFEPNIRMATPANYTIGPDDVLLLDLTGDNEAHYKLNVSPEGFITMEYVGRIAVGGLTVEQATSKIRSGMGTVYPGLRTGRSQIALNIGNIRSIKVIITGEATKPGTFTLPSVASVFNALYAAGGPNSSGSFRNIQVIRGNRVIATVDLYDFLVNGIQSSNIRLEDQDVIHIPVYQIHVDVLGEVKRSAIYEIRAEESLVDVLRYAGGFSDKAYKARVKIIQNTANAQQLLVKNLNEFPNYQPKNGDKVFVEPIFESFENRVQVLGAVLRPGSYQFKEGLTLSQLIKKADGLSPDVFMNRGYIIRTQPDNTTSLISFNVSDVMKGGAADLSLQSEDLVQLSSIFDLRDEYTVSIGGEVRKPGGFSYSENMTVSDLIQMAGGFKQGGSPLNIEVSRRVESADLNNKSAITAEVFNLSIDSALSTTNIGFVLKPYDIVSVRAKEGYGPQRQVQIQGEVLHPGIYSIQSKNERISDIIKRAGGLTAFAYSKGASLKRPGNNTSDGYNLLKDPEEERLRNLNLARLKQAGANDSLLLSTSNANSFSDLVGIELDKILENPGSRGDLLMEGGDIIRIPTLLQTVKVTGEVLRPISVVYKPGRSFKYYINSAGGFTKNAYKRGAFISNANGSVAGTTKTVFFNNYPSVEPGSEISVPTKPIREKISAQGWIGIGTGLASLAALIFAILK